MRATLAIPSLLVLLGGAWSSGCAMNRIADHCAGCVVFGRGAPPPEAPGGARRLAVLVHGAGGFGHEWEPIVAALRAADVAFVVFEWNGPFRDLTGDVEALSAGLQHVLDGSPELAELLILAHSAGGPLATRAARRLRVPAERRVQLADVAAPSVLNGRPFFRDRLDRLPAMPAGVSRAEYLTEDSPFDPPIDDPRRVYLGARVGHNEALARAGLPLITSLGLRTAAGAR